MARCLPRCRQVYLVAHQYPRRFLVLLEEFLPHPDVLQRALLGDVVDEDDALRIFEVGRD